MPHQSRGPQDLGARVYGPPGRDRPQLSVYSYAVGLSPFANGDDLRLRFDVLTKTKQPELCRYWTTRDRAANVRLFRLVSEVLGAVDWRVSLDRRLAVKDCVLRSKSL